MATHHPMVFDQRKRYTYHHSNLKTPITLLSKINSQPQFSQEKHKNFSSKETVNLVQECRSMKSKKMGIELPCSIFVDDEEFLEEQPFFEEPVSFDFGDDYGNQLFLDLQEELDNNGLFHGCRGLINVVEGIKYTRDDIYILSPEAGMINSFLRDNLF